MKKKESIDLDNFKKENLIFFPFSKIPKDTFTSPIKFAIFKNNFNLIDEIIIKLENFNFNFVSEDDKFKIFDLDVRNLIMENKSEIQCEHCKKMVQLNKNELKKKYSIIFEKKSKLIYLYSNGGAKIFNKVIYQLNQKFKPYFSPIKLTSKEINKILYKLEHEENNIEVSKCISKQVTEGKKTDVKFERGRNYNEYFQSFDEKYLFVDSIEFEVEKYGKIMINRGGIFHFNKSNSTQYIINSFFNCINEIIYNKIDKFENKARNMDLLKIHKFKFPLPSSFSSNNLKELKKIFSREYFFFDEVYSNYSQVNLSSKKYFGSVDLLFYEDKLVLVPQTQACGFILDEIFAELYNFFGFGEFEEWKKAKKFQ